MTYHCPQCGEKTERLFEGYCEPCRDDNQAALDTHNAAFDRWQRMDARERANEIGRAIVLSMNARSPR